MRRSISVYSRSTCSIFQIPLNVGQPFIGTCSAPQQLMEGGLATVLSDLGWKIDVVNPGLFDQSQFSDQFQDEGDFNPKNCRIAGKAMQAIEEGIVKYAEKENFLLMLGGDHCIPIGTIAAVKRARPNTGIVWVDAHADINTPQTSSSGNLHGMPLSFLLGLHDTKSLPSFEYFEPCLKPSDIVYIGLRDVDKEEKKIIKDLGIKAFTMADIDRYGIGKIMDMCVDHLGEKDIHLSFDVDAMDPFYAPSTGTAVRGGLNFREGNYVCESLFATGRLRSMDLVEVNPMLSGAEDAKSTVAMGIKLCSASMGNSIL